MKMVFRAILFLTILATLANAGQVSLTPDEDGDYVNLPATGTDTLVIPLAYTEGGSFKVYDDGLNEYDEGYYSNNANGALALTAPDGYAFLITGSVYTEMYWDSLNIYKGNPENNVLIMGGIQGYIDEFYAVAVGPTIVLKFQSDGGGTDVGLDLDVQLVESSSYTVSINNVEGGSVTSDINNGESLVAMGDVVTLTATPAAGYVLSGIDVKGSDDEPVKVTGGFWYSNNAATFTMPQKNVTVTPVFEEVDLPYIKMPAHDKKVVSIPSGVTSFKLYDDGGKDGNYTSDAYAYLVLNAPEGCLFQISGTVDITENAYIDLFEGDENDVDNYIGSLYGENTEIETITATMQSVGLEFGANDGETRSGFALTITVIDPSAPLTVTLNDGGHGTVEADNLTPVGGETVTLTATPDPNYILTGIEVRGVYDHQPVEVEGGFWHTGNSATFVMPQKDVEVTPVFGPASEASINMPTTGTVMVDVPSGLTSFKVYDDGGIDENYSNDADGYMVMTAPSGYIFQISGSAKTEEDYDYVDVYDGNMETFIKRMTGTTEMAQVLSSVNVAALYFYSDGYYGDEGFVLTVELVEAAESHSITLNNVIGGTVTANKELAYVGDDVSLGVNLDEGFLLNELNVVRSDGKAVNVQWGTWYSMNTATFTMPYADVEVTPEYASGPTAGDGLYAKIPMNSRSVDVNIPQDVSSFNVYHGDFENHGNGQLVLYAPEDFRIKVSGMDKSRFQSSLLIVEDDEYGNEENLWGGEDCACPDEIMSNSRKLKIRLDSYDPSTELNLTVVVINPNMPHVVVDANDIVNGSIDADVRSAKMGDIVTLTAAPADGYLLQEIQVADAEGNAIEVNGGSWATENTATFVMPYSNVTIKPIFTTARTATDGLYVNMPNNTKRTLVIPEGVTSFKVYDDGGAGEDVHETYNAPGHDTLTLKAPEGYFLKVSGNVKKNGKITQAKFVVFNGDVHSDTLYKIHSAPAFNINFDPVTSLGSEMTLYLFGSLYNTHVSSYIDMNLTVELVPTTQYAAISTVNVGGRNIAVIDGAYNGDGQISIPTQIGVDTAVFKRNFSTSGFSTIMLPFNVTAGNIEGARSVIAFDGMVLNEATGDSAISMRYVWCNSDVVTAAAAKGENLTCNSDEAELSAYTPYMVEMESATLTFNGAQTLKQTPASAEARVKGWVFRATLQKKDWESSDEEIQGGRVWAFAAQERDGAKIGKYVRLGPGATTRPLRAYLVSDPQAPTQARGLFARSSARNEASVLPETIDVVIVNHDENGEEHTTVIGKFDTRTGEMRLDRNARTFDLNGRNVGGRVNAKGMYLKK